MVLDRRLRAVIVGAGPSGFYSAEQLLAAGFDVDVLDTLPTPFGLVRSGVAPDHPKIKSVTRMFDKIAAKPGFRFVGGATLGDNVTRAELLDRYHAVVYAFGTPDDIRLGIPGEDRPGSHPATHFVQWYNGHPDGADRCFDLSSQRAVVIGNGNVALDVARMLVLHPQELAATDTADHALQALSDSRITEVVVLGRRGPAQGAFTTPELAELGRMRRAEVAVDPTDLDLDPCSARWLEDTASPIARRNVETLRSYAGPGGRVTSHRIVLRFLTSPVEILGEGIGGAVTGIRVVRNRIVPTDDGTPVAVATDEEHVIECGLVLRAIGYRGRPIDGVPFDPSRGVIPNRAGRVLAAEGHCRPGEYVVGWIKRGPSGVIGTNKKDATDTVASIIEDAEAGLLNTRIAGDRQQLDKFFASRVPDVVTWRGWQAIDETERAAGRLFGRDRVKLVRRAELIDVGQAIVSTL